MEFERPDFSYQQGKYSGFDPMFAGNGIAPSKAADWNWLSLHFSTMQSQLQAGSGISGVFSVVKTGSLIVTGLTQGSALFVGPGGVITQSNPFFFFDNANSRLGLATNSPSVTLDVNGDIRDRNMTSGSVLFAGTGGVISQNNASFFWDNANLVLKADNAQFKGSPWFDVKRYGAVGDGVTDDGTAIQNTINAVPASGGTVYFPAGTFLFATGLTATANRNIRFVGSGKKATILSYTGAGIALTLGSAGSPGSQDGLEIHSLKILGTGAATVGIDLIIFNCFLLKNVFVSGFSAGPAVRINGSNSGSCVACDFSTNSIGIQFVSNGVFGANLNNIIACQMSTNGTAIQSTGGAFQVNITGCGIVATTASPAVDIRQGSKWTLKDNYFDNNKGGAGTSTIRLGTTTVADAVSGMSIEGNFFIEGNSPQWGIQIVRATGSKVAFNQNASTFTSSFVRTETNAASSVIYGNDFASGSGTLISDVSTTADHFLMGQATVLKSTNQTPLDAAGVGSLGYGGLVFAGTAQGYVGIFDNLQATANNRNGIFVLTAATDTASYIAKFESGGVNRMTFRADGFTGFGTTTPRRLLDLLDASNPQLRLTQADNSKYVDFQSDGTGNLGVTLIGSTATFTIPGATATFNVTAPTASAQALINLNGGAAGFGQMQNTVGTFYITNADATGDIRLRTNSVEAWRLDVNLTLSPRATLATTMTTGFINIPGAAGAPSGTPATTAGFPLYWDSTALQLYVYTGGAWKKSAAFT